MRRLLTLAAAATLCAGPFISGGVAQAAVSAPPVAQINGSGSSWASNALEIWIKNVGSLSVVFTNSGSAAGRSDFRFYTNDFAVSDIGFQGTDPLNGSNDSACQNLSTVPPSKCRPYVYLPIVAGGTSFPYQIRVAGRLVDSLRLSGETLAKIFTDQIKNWNDPAIAKDNNGHFFLAGGGEVSALPSTPITPVVHSEGSGSTAQFTTYLDTQFSSMWRVFAKVPTNELSAAPGKDFTEYWPQAPGQRAQSGSDGVMNFLTSAAGNGAIGFDEYSYPKDLICSGCGANGWPTALLENQAGYFTAPTQYDVAVALTKAQINMDKSSPNYLIQNLSQVYTNPDKRAYAMSSYSYMIIPTSPTDQTMSTPKRQALADFITFDVCGGQRLMGGAGYSPLPINLAQASFQQMDKLHTADKHVQITQLNIATSCKNPTFWAGHPDGNFLAQIAPQPPSCDQSGQGPCAPGVGVGATGNPQNGKPPAPTTSSPTPSSSTGTTGAGTPSSGISSSTGTGTGSGLPGSTGSGLPGSTGGSTGGNSGGNATLIGTSASLAGSEGSGYGGLLAVLAAVEVLLLLALPPIIARRRQSRGLGGGSGRESGR
jgi:phosphate transport system substrate-binding protein